MKTFAILASGIMLTALMTLAGAAQAATFVYVSKRRRRRHRDLIPCYPTGTCCPARASGLGSPVMPMSVSPDRRFSYAAVRSKPSR